MSEEIVCPIGCLNYDADDWLTKHSTFTLTLIGSLSACLGVVMSYFLKSRCSKISIGCISCDRVPPSDTVNTVNINDVNVNEVP
jgi:hypothetical protein